MLSSSRQLDTENDLLLSEMFGCWGNNTPACPDEKDDGAHSSCETMFLVTALNIQDIQTRNCQNPTSFFFFFFLPPN